MEGSLTEKDEVLAKIIEQKETVEVQLTEVQTISEQREEKIAELTANIKEVSDENAEMKKEQSNQVRKANADEAGLDIPESELFEMSDEAFEAVLKYAKVEKTEEPETETAKEEESVEDEAAELAAKKVETATQTNSGVPAATATVPRQEEMSVIERLVQANLEVK